jgi:cobaltochelatase CobN
VLKNINRTSIHFFLLLTIIFSNISLANGQDKISLIMSDFNQKVTYNSIKQIYSDYPWLKEKVSFKTYSVENIRSQDLNYLANSKLVFVWIHGFGASVEKVEEELLKVLQNNGKVYALGTSPAEDKYRDMGISFNKEVMAYASAGGTDNISNMIKNRLRKDLSLSVSFAEAAAIPKKGFYEYNADTIYTDYESYLKNYQNYTEGNPGIGFLIERYNVVSDQTAHINTFLKSIERYGFNVVPVFGFPVDSTMQNFFLDEDGSSRVDLIVTLGLWHGVNPDRTRLVFEEIGVPVINSIQLMNNEKEWRESPSGIDIWQRTLLVAIPELMGASLPTVSSSKETLTIKATDEQYFEQQPIIPRVNMLVDRVKSWYLLQKKPNQEKKVALIYYSYPPGKENIGASYLNVLPKSLLSMLEELKKQDYNLGDAVIDSNTIYDDVMSYGRNIGNWAEGEIESLVATGKPVMIPVEEYKQWFNELDPAFQKEMIEGWGKVEESDIMTWRDRNNKTYLIIPAIKYGNILLTPQPARGWGQDVEKMYHDVSIPPPHQYVAFYLYLKKSFQADAVVHIGTHGTHEWLRGKEVGFTNADSPEALIQDMPNIYPYIVDDVGEGLQVKRRGMGVIIDHMTPPFDKAGLNPELKKLTELINEHNVAHEKSSLLSNAKHKAINELAVKMGITKDIGLEAINTDEDIHKLEHYIKEISEKNTPFGLHTFGKAPKEDYIKKTAEAMASVDKELNSAQRAELEKEYIEKIKESGKRELASLIAALNGKYIPTGKGGDPLRNPSSLPTGKNFYSFDPSKIPSKAIYKLGSKMAEDVVSQYKKEHGVYPDKLTFNLWSTECIRHEGVMESQVMNLLGVKPKWDKRGKVVGLEVIPRHILKRPRIDVVIVPSGLYRDIFANIMQMIDNAVTLAKEQDEQDNFVRNHILAMKKDLVSQGVDDELADRLASVRMFSVPPGAYGTGMEDVIEASGTWEKEEEVISVFFNRFGHLYGQGFWGVKAEEVNKDLEAADFSSINLFKKNLSGVKVAVHSRSTNLYGVLDNDDFYQYLGSTAMAVRSIDGTTPEIYVTNLTDPSNPRQESLDKFMGREMRSRYLNPKWIKEMMAEGYSGARFIKRVVAHLWGWQVTVPEAVDEAKWQEMYETYVEDKFDLDIKEQFRESKNLWAYQNILARMIETTRKEYWNPDDEVIANLTEEFIKTVEEAGLACSGNICDNQKLSDAIIARLEKTPGLEAKAEMYKQELEKMQENRNTVAAVPNPAEQIAKTTAENTEYLPKKPVEGYELTEVSNNNTVSDVLTKSTTWLFVLTIVFFIGWFMKSRKRTMNKQ